LAETDAADAESTELAETDAADMEVFKSAELAELDDAVKSSSSPPQAANKQQNAMKTEKIGQKTTPFLFCAKIFIISPNRQGVFHCLAPLREYG
jgi:hypothetical protein